jgi:uncharacterized protein involved in exopolysaccharide biosynthesis
MRRAAGLPALTVVTIAGCSSDEESPCQRLSDRLDSIEAQAAGLTEQSWENLVRVQELQTERTNVRRQMAEEGCTVGT